MMRFSIYIILNLIILQSSALNTDSIPLLQKFPKDIQELNVQSDPIAFKVSFEVIEHNFLPYTSILPIINNTLHDKGEYRILGRYIFENHNEFVFWERRYNQKRDVFLSSVNSHYQYNPNLLIYSNIGEYDVVDPIQFFYNPHYPNSITIIQKYPHMEGGGVSETRQFYQLDNTLHIFFDEDMISGIILDKYLIHRRKTPPISSLVATDTYATECNATTYYRMNHIPKIDENQDSMSLYGVYLPVLPSDKIIQIIDSIVNWEWIGERFPLPKKVVSEHLWPTQNEVWSVFNFGYDQQYFGYGLFKIRNHYYLLYSTEGHMVPEIYLADLQSSELYPKTLVLFSVCANPYAWILPSELAPDNYLELYNSYEQFQLLKQFIKSSD